MLLTCRRAQSVLDKIGRWVEKGTQVKVWHVKSDHSVISDFGVSVEAVARVHVKLPISSVKNMGDVVSQEFPLVFGCIPKGEKHNCLSVQIRERRVYHFKEHPLDLNWKIVFFLFFHSTN